MDRYKEILHLPHRQSGKRPHMAMAERAAQFSPFAALTGYDAAIAETGRLTDEKIELSEAELDELNARFQILVEKLTAAPEVTVTYFKPDERKAGGAYHVMTGAVKKVDDFERLLVFCDGTRLSMEDIVRMEGEIFRKILRQGNEPGQSVSLED